MAQSMEKLIERLEVCVRRLETAQPQGGAPSVTSPAGSSSSSGSKLIKGFDDVLTLVQEWKGLSEQIGDLVDKQVDRYSFMWM